MAEAPQAAPAAEPFEDVTNGADGHQKKKKKKSVSKKWEKQLLEHYDGRYWQFNSDGAKREPKRKRHNSDFYTDDGFTDGNIFNDEVDYSIFADEPEEQEAVSSNTVAASAPSSSSSVADIQHNTRPERVPTKKRVVIEDPGTIQSDNFAFPTALENQRKVQDAMEQLRALREGRTLRRSDSSSDFNDPDAETELPIFPRQDTPPPQSPPPQQPRQRQQQRKPQHAAQPSTSSLWIDLSGDNDDDIVEDDNVDDDFMDVDTYIVPGHSNSAKRNKEQQSPVPYHRSSGPPRPKAVIPELPKSEVEIFPTDQKRKQSEGEAFSILRAERERREQQQRSRGTNTLSFSSSNIRQFFEPQESPPPVRRVRPPPPRPQDPPAPIRWTSRRQPVASNAINILQDATAVSSAVAAPDSGLIKLKVILTAPHQQELNISIPKTSLVSDLMNRIKSESGSNARIAMLLYDGAALQPTETLANSLKQNINTTNIIRAVPEFPATRRGIPVSDWIKSWHPHVSFSAPRGSDFQGLLFSHFAHFAPIFTQSNGLASIHLDRCGITPPQFQVIANTFIRSSAASLQHLCLSRNFIDASSIALLESILSESDLVLQSLDLSHNPLSDNSARSIAEIVSRALPHFQTLSLRGCGITPQFFKDIQHYPFSVHELDLSINSLGTEGVSYFSSALLKSDLPCILQRLSLERNSIDGSFKDELARLLSLNALELSLSNNPFGAHADVFEGFFIAPNHLEKLDLSFCSMGTSAMDVLLSRDASVVFPKLKQLNCRGNMFKECLNSLLTFISSIPSLELVDLSFCGWSAPEQIEIASSCAVSMPQLRHLLILESNDRAIDLDDLIALFQRVGNRWHQLQINCGSSMSDIQQEIKRFGWMMNGSAIRWNLMRPAAVHESAS
eukprot:TRINITY_DN6960_c0_g1_i1.p1 TRINITY_DN6960_c0_g1~~TRINITY_DN6960_c0_g1_i1.p1  ORF type:complete len:900 (+),score=157.24 TRINITY_DN6960_c0_g1_i1:41-2740(+)